MAKPGLDEQGVADYMLEIRRELEAETPEGANDR